MAVIFAGIVFWSVRIFLMSYDQVTSRPAAIIHSTPVGGTVQDGVFRSLPADGDVRFSRWRI